MPTPGLSLVGFLDQPAAMNHFQNACVMPNPTPQALLQEWATARQRLGNPVANAGNPQILPIPAQFLGYVQQVMTAPHNADFFRTFPAVRFELVEIEPLLAYQFAISDSRSNHHCGGLSTPPTPQELLGICLPTNQQTETFQAFPGQNSLLIRSPSLNFKAMQAGVVQFAPTVNGVTVQLPPVVGALLGVTWPFVHVTRFNGQCFLHNGYHRVYGAARAGATHVPSIVRDVASYVEAGVTEDGQTFPSAAFTSGNSPTMGHFTQGRAHPVTLREATRVVHVTWSEYAIPEA